MTEVKNDFDIEQWAKEELKLYKSLISKAKAQEHNQQSIKIFKYQYKKVDGYYVAEDPISNFLYIIIKEDQIQKEWMEAVEVYLDYTNREIVRQIEYRENEKNENVSRHSTKPITGLCFDDQENLLKPVHMYGFLLTLEEAVEVVREKKKEIHNDIRKLEAEQEKLTATETRIVGYTQQPEQKTFISRNTLMPVEVPEQYRVMFDAARKFNSITK